jgi:opacity protein-like surface antigen
MPGWKLDIEERRTMDTRLGAALVAATMLAAAPLQASEWEHEIAPYLWGAALDGTTGVGNATADVDVGFDDILDNLEMGFMGAYRGTRDRFSIGTDFVYMGLGATERGPGGVLEADVDIDQIAFEVTAGYEVIERLVLFGGLRYNDLSTDVEVRGPLGNVERVDGDESWVDPLIGAHYTIPINDTWSASLRGDIGGFGVGSDFAWQGVAAVRWQVSPRVGIALAYRYMDMDYEDDRFVYDMAISGPALGAVFTF